MNRYLPISVLLLLAGSLGNSAQASPEYGEPSVRDSMRYVSPGVQQRYYRCADKLGICSRLGPSQCAFWTVTQIPHHLSAGIRLLRSIRQR